MSENGFYPYPPSFPVENWRDKMRVFSSSQDAKDYVNGVIKRVFPKEIFGDSMTIRYFLWKPHNYRLKVPFSKVLRLDSTPKGNDKVLSAFPVEISSKGIKTYKLSSSLVVQVCKTCVMVIWGEDKWFKVDSRGFSGFVDRKVESIRDDILSALNGLNLGLDLNFEGMVWVRQENTLKGDEFLDSIPKRLMVDDTCFKKVYDDNVEFKDASYVKSYVKNRVLEDFGAYDGRISALEDKFNRSNPLFFLKDNVKSPDDVIKFKYYVSILSDVEKVFFTDWMFVTGCGRS